MKTSIPILPTGDVLVYKFGCRLDADCQQIVNEQITLARRMYNDLVAEMRRVVDARSQRLFELAGPSAVAIRDQIESSNQAFAAARAASDEDAMKLIAKERRELWSQMSAALKVVNLEHKEELRAFLRGVGKNSSCTTYQIRSRYVSDGLGWATANQVLDSALQAFQSTIKKGQAPRFAVGSEITRDSLYLQFTVAGGVAADRLLQGEHSELKLLPPVKGYGRRCYGSFSMRMGAAKAAQWASGTWQAHRPIPLGARVASVSLVRDRVGTKNTWSIQLLLKLSERVSAAVAPQRKPLAVIHLGWSADPSGRRIGAVASAADPGLAKPLHLPHEVETRLTRSAEIQAKRDRSRDEVVPRLKDISKDIVDGWPEPIREDYCRIIRLPANRVAASRLHRLWWALFEGNHLTPEMEALTTWRAVDKLDHQASVSLARSARGRRKDFYRNLALRQCQEFDAIVLDQPDLQASAPKISEVSGQRNELGRDARSGRVVASLHEYSQALKWAATRCATTLIEVDGDSATVCAHCGHIGLETVEDTQYQQQQCPACGAVVDRKCNSAASVFQRVSSKIEVEVAKAAEVHAIASQAAKAKQRDRLAKVQESRRGRLAADAATSADLE